MPTRVATERKPAVLQQTITIPNDQSSAPAPAQSDRPDFWSYMQSLSSEAWKDHVVYVTREEPKTSITGLGGYLVKIQQAFDIEDIKNAYGGREFSYIMKKKNDIAYSGRFRIEAPPKFDSARENAAAPSSNGDSSSTKLVEQFVGVLREELARSRENGNGNSAVTDAAITMLSNASTKAMEVVKAQIPQAENPGAQLSSLVTTLKELGLVGNAGANRSAIAELIDLAKPFLPLLAPLVQRLLTPADPMAQVTMFLTIFEKLDALRGGAATGGGAHRATTQDVIIEGIKTLPDMLDRMNAQRDANAQRAAQQAAYQRAQELARRSPGPPPQPANAPQASAPSPQAPPPHTAAAPLPSAAPISSDGLRTVRLTDDVAITEPAPPAAAPEGFTDHESRIADHAVPSPGSQEEYDTLIKVHVAQMVAMELDGETIMIYLEDAKPEMVDDIGKYSDEQLTAFFLLDPIMSKAAQHERWPDVLKEAREYLAANGEPARAATAAQ